jgi:predicted hydrocarbon binding protein
MVHAAYPCFSPVYCASAIGYYEQALLIHHAIPTRVEETSCQCDGDPSCTFELGWA